MGKLPKNRKRTKTKLKKKTTSKSKNRTSSKKTSGAPEIEKTKMEILEDQQQPSDTSEAPEFVYKLIRKVMKVDHIKSEDKAIRNAQRALKKAESSGNDNEISEAKATLEEAFQEKEEAKFWMNPKAAIKKLNQTLSEQIENSEDLDLIEMTKEFISEAEDAQRYIDQGQEDTFYFRLIQTRESLLDVEKSNYIINDSDSENEAMNLLPPIEHQEEASDDQNVSKLFHEHHIAEQNEIDLTDGQDSIDEGQKTPVAGSKSTKSINVIQDKLNKALQILTPQEKIMKMKQQAKMNAQKRKKELEKLENERKLKSSKSKDAKKSKNSNDNRKEKKVVKKAKPKKNRYSELASDSESSNTSSKSDNESNDEYDSTSDDEQSQQSSHNDDMSDDDSEENTSENEYDEESESEDDDMSESSQQKNSSKKKSKKLTSSSVSKKPKSRLKSKDSVKSKMKQTTISIKRNHNVYYSVKLCIEKGPIPTKQLELALTTWYKQLLLMDSSVIIYKFENETPQEAILDSKNLPTDFSTMKQFFNNVNVKPNGGHTWFQVWLGHDEPYDNILTNMKHWSSSSDTYMYRKRLQHKYSSKDYWLLWSTERMDTEVLHNEVSGLMKKYSKKEFAFSFNFSFLRKEQQYDKKKDNESNKWNKALVIEVKREDKDQIHYILGKIFSTSNNEKILGTNLRMIPMLNNDLPSHTKMKISHLIAKQEQFLSTLIIKPCLFVSEIDYYNVKLETTMREIIMNLETLRTFNSKGESMKIFQNIDYSSWHASYVVTYPKHLSKEAEDYIAQLPAYLHYIYGDEVLHMLSADGMARAHSSKWDPENLCATSNLDLELDAVATESSDKGWLPTLQMEVVEFDTENIEWQAELHKRATDADSVSTFASKTKVIQQQNSENSSVEDDESEDDQITPTKKTQKIKRNKKFQSNIISPQNDTRPPSLNDQQTRESTDHDGMNTSRITASDLGASL